MCRSKCDVCNEILTVLDRPLWFCRICKYVNSNPRVIRRHITRLVEEDKVRTKDLGGMRFYARRFENHYRS